MTSFPWGKVKGGPATSADASSVSSDRPNPGVSAEMAAEAGEAAALVADSTPKAAGNNSPGAASPGTASANSGALAAGEAMVEHSPGRVNDAELIREAQRGNRAAFEELVRLYDQAVLRLALRLTGSEQEARDIYQEAFLKAYRYLGGFRFECSFYTWIYRIVSNLCLDHLRRKEVRKEDPPVVMDQKGQQINLLEQVADERSGASPERDLLRRELGARIAAALNKLTPRERLVFEMKHYQGLRLRTIGEALNTTEETAKNTLFRATQKLRAALADAR